MGCPKERRGLSATLAIESSHRDSPAQHTTPATAKHQKAVLKCLILILFFKFPILDKGIFQLCLPVGVRAGQYSAQATQQYILMYGSTRLIQVGGLC